MTAHRIGNTIIHIRPIATNLRPGHRICYIPPTPELAEGRPGIIQAISGVSALIVFDDCPWLQWTPLERLRPDPAAPNRP